METVYLDTHIVLWLCSGESKLLNKRAFDLINQSQLLVSPAVSLELQFLWEIKKIIKSPQDILEDLTKEIGTNLCSKGFFEVVAESARHSWTRDPFDRLITAQASLGNDFLLTRDRSILDNYSKAVW